MNSIRVSVFGVLAVVAVLLLLGTATVVEATPDDHTVPLDRGFENVGSVTVDGETYEVYRYGNVLPYASGHEFFADGERVGDAEEARRVARAYGWKVAMVEEMDDTDVENLRDVGRTANRAGAVISTPLSAVETALVAVDEAKRREVATLSVWDIAVSAVPQLDGIESALRTVRDELRRWDERVGDVGEDVTRIAEEAESVRADGEAEYDELPSLFEDASEGLEDAEEISGAVSNDLSEAADLTGRIADELEDVRRVGDDLASPFRRLSDSLEETTERVGAFTESAGEARDAVEATHERSSAEETRLTTGWNRRQSAALRVYGTGLAVVLVLVGGGFYMRRRSAEETRPDE